MKREIEELNMDDIANEEIELKKLIPAEIVDGETEDNSGETRLSDN